MSFKQIISSILIASTLSVTLPAKKAEASIAIGIGTSVPFMIQGGRATLIGIGYISAPIILIGSTVGGIVSFFNPVAGIIIITLGENQALEQSDLEEILNQKYPFIQDQSIISDLATLVKQKTESMKAKEGQIIVGVSENEIKKILESTDLIEAHSYEVQQMIKELK